MKNRSRAILFAALLGGAFAPACMFAAPLAAPSRTLAPGDQNHDVLLLQKILNASPATQIAASGSGSPGMENEYYGNKTTAAVRRFQSLHSAEILAPQGLTTPTGIVGSSTLRALQQTAANLGAGSRPTNAAATAIVPKNAPATAAVAPTPSSTIPAPIPLTPNMKIPEGVNPNAINLDYSIAQIDALGKKQGMDPAKLAAIESAVRTTALSTTTNYAQKFFDSVKYGTATGTASALGRTKSGNPGTLFTRLLIALGILHVAQADIGVNFGGRIVGVFPCTCAPVNVGIILAPPEPPTYATILSYTLGTELYASNNMPLLGISVLGTYIPAVPACLQYVGVACVPTPTWGHVSPLTGSSLLP